MCIETELAIPGSPGRVIHTLPVDHRPRVVGMVERLHVQALIAQFAVEALAVPVLPGAARLDVMRGGPLLLQPVLQLPGDELRAVVAANEPWGTMQCEQFAQHPDDAPAADPRGHLDPVALAGELVHHAQQLQLPAVLALVVHEVIRPYVIHVLRRAWDACANSLALATHPAPQAQPVLHTQSPHTLHVHRLALASEQGWSLHCVKTNPSPR